MFRYVSSCLLAGLMTSCAIDIPVSPGPFPADTTVMTDPSMEVMRRTAAPALSLIHLCPIQCCETYRPQTP